MEAVVWILQSLDGGTTIPAVAELLHARNAATRNRAVRVLSKLKAAGAVDLLLAALHDPDAAVRLRAVGALSRCAEDRMKSAFEKRLARESDGLVRAAIESALARVAATNALAAWWSFELSQQGHVSLHPGQSPRHGIRRSGPGRAHRGQLGP